MKNLKVGVFGLGRIGKVHLKNLKLNFPQIQLVSITSSENGREFSDKLGVTEIYYQHGKAIKNANLNAILICTPSNTHTKFAHDFIDAGIDIYCEKPLDLELKEIRNIGNAAKEAGIKLMVGFNQRFDPTFLSVRDRVRAGSVGDLQIVKISSRDPEPPPIYYIKESGGMFMDMTIHDFDMTRNILGHEIDEVYATGGAYHYPEIGEAGDIDTSSLLLKSKKNVHVHIDNTRFCTYGYDQRLEVFGTKGMSLGENKKLSDQIFFDGRGITAEKPMNFFMDRYTDSYTNIMNSFINSLIHNTDVEVGVHDALMATSLALAANKSLATGLPVKVDDILHES